MDPSQSAELKKRLAFVSIEYVPVSQEPFRVTRKRTGCIERSCLTREEAEEYVLTLDVAKLATKPKRGPRRQ